MSTWALGGPPVRGPYSGSWLGQSWARGQGESQEMLLGAGGFLATARTSSALRFFPFIVDLKPWNLMSTPVGQGRMAPAHLILSVAPFPRVLCLVTRLSLPKAVLGPAMLPHLHLCYRSKHICEQLWQFPGFACSKTEGGLWTCQLIVIQNHFYEQSPCGPGHLTVGRRPR